MKETSKYPFSNDNNAHSITKYGDLGQLDVQIVALRAHSAQCTPSKVTGGAQVKKDARCAPGTLTLPL